MPVPMEGMEKADNNSPPSSSRSIDSESASLSLSQSSRNGKKNKVLKALRRVSSHLTQSNGRNISMDDEDPKTDASQNGKDCNNADIPSINVPRSASFDANANSDDTASENSLSVSLDSRSSPIVHGSLSDSNLKSSHGQTSLKSRFSALSPKKRTSSASSKSGGRAKFLTQMLPGLSTKSKFELFKKVFNLPEGEQPIADFACALHRDILVQGRLYATQNWICFYANIFRWETLVTMKWEDVIAITKEKTVKVIPNALKLTTSSDKYFFSSFVSQKHAYTTLFRVWQNVLLGQPLNPLELRTLCTRITKRRNTEDGEPLHDDADETADEAVESERMMFDEQSVLAQNELAQSHNNELLLSDVNSPREASVSSEGQLDNEPPKLVPTPPSPPNGDTTIPLLLHSMSYGGNVLHPPIDIPENSKKYIPSASPLAKRAEHFFKMARRKKKTKFASSHKISRLETPDNLSLGDTSDGEEGVTSEDELDAIPDEVCPCINQHEGPQRINEVFPLDIDTVFSHIFSEDSDVIRQVYKDRSIRDVTVHPKEDESDGSKLRLITYTVALNYAVGPKSSDTELKERYSSNNRPGQCFVINTEAASHGVPYADKFRVHTRYCLTRCQGNYCRVLVHSIVKYTGHVFGPIKGMIAKSADEAMKNYFISLGNALRGKCSITLPLIPGSIRSKIKVEKDAPASNVMSHTVGDVPRKGVLPETSFSQKHWFAFMSSTEFIGVLFAVFLALLCMNSYLYIRLRDLEKITFALDEFSSDIPRTDDDWQKLLVSQKQLHRADILQMKELIGSTVKLMQQVESSVSKLYREIDILASSRPPGRSESTVHDSAEAA